MSLDELDIYDEPTCVRLVNAGRSLVVRAGGPTRGACQWQWSPDWKQTGTPRTKLQTTTPVEAHRYGYSFPSFPLSLKAPGREGEPDKSQGFLDDKVNEIYSENDFATRPGAVVPAI